MISNGKETVCILWHKGRELEVVIVVQSFIKQWQCSEPFAVSKNVLVYYRKCCNLIGYATHYLFVISKISELAETNSDWLTGQTITSLEIILHNFFVTRLSLHISLKIELSEGEEVVYLVNFGIFIISAFMKAVKHEENVEHRVYKIYLTQFIFQVWNFTKIISHLSLGDYGYIKLAASRVGKYSTS